MNQARFFLLLFIGLIHFDVSVAQEVPTVQIFWKKHLQRIDGIGVGQGAWSASFDLLSSKTKDRICKLAFDSTNGAGFSILRMEIGSELRDSGARVTAPTIQPKEGFWDYDIDRAQIDFMQRAQKMGVKRIIAAAFSPPAWMKTNQTHLEGGTLKKINYAVYAQYLHHYVHEYKKRHHINFYAISPANEPQHKHPFQSCIWSGKDIAHFTKDYLKPTFEKSGLKTKIILGETFEWSDKPFLTEALEDPQALKSFDLVAAHGYNGVSVAQPLQATAQKNKKYWLTEQAFIGCKSSSIEDGLLLAGKIWENLQLAGSSAYLYWLLTHPVKGNDESLIEIDTKADTFEVRKAFYCMAHFSRFIRSNYICVSVVNQSEVQIAFFKSLITGHYCLIAINNSQQQQKFQMQKEGFNSTDLVPYITSATQNLEKLPKVSVDAPLMIPPKSIVTFVGKGHKTL